MEKIKIMVVFGTRPKLRWHPVLELKRRDNMIVSAPTGQLKYLINRQDIQSHVT